MLIADDCFPSLHFLLSELAERIGFTLVTVRTRPGGIGVEEGDFLATWDARVALGVVTWVTSTASRRADLGTIIAHARAHGSLVAADITQAAGKSAIRHRAIPGGLRCQHLPEMDGCGALAPASAMSHLVCSKRCDLGFGSFSQPDPFNWHIDGSAWPTTRGVSTTVAVLFAVTRPCRGCAGCMRTGIAQVSAHNLLLCRAY